LDQAEDAYSKYRNQQGTVALDEEAKVILNRSADLQAKLLEAQQKRREMEGRFTAEHPVVRTLDAQISAFNREISAMNIRVKSMPTVQQDAIRLERDVKVNNELYQSLRNSALQLQLVREGNEAVLAFSGKEDDYRSPGYTEGLKKYVSDHGLEQHVRFLGFLDRDEQLQLMNHALAVVQPSLFEGWSTVVEDGKAMSQVILASGLDVHHEQLDNWEGTSAFFEGRNSAQLAEQMKRVLNGELKRQSSDYNRNVKQFGSDFAGIIERIAQ
jgi:glycosyltransferase involved in cell wall biosynthesis